MFNINLLIKDVKTVGIVESNSSMAKIELKIVIPGKHSILYVCHESYIIYLDKKIESIKLAQ